MNTFKWDKDLESNIVPLQIQRFLIEHGYTEGIQLLREAPYGLKIRHDEEHACYVFTYDMVASDMTQDICQEARGLMLNDVDPRKIVSIGFNKFFNYGEVHAQPAVQAIESEFQNGGYVVVREKLDGSIIKISAIDKTKPINWHNMFISTNNVPNAFTVAIPEPSPQQGVFTFGDAVRHAMVEGLSGQPSSTFQLPGEWTYIFELTGPFNRVVVPYDKNQIRYLGRRNVYTAEEQYVGTAQEASGEWPLLEMLETDSTKHALLKLTHTGVTNNESSFFAAAQEIVDTYDWKQEGLVVSTVKDGVTYHVKLKGSEYLAIHRLRGEMMPTKKRILEMLYEAQVDDFLGYFPEYSERVEVVRADVSELYRRLNEAQHLTVQLLGAGRSRKELAEELQSKYSPYVAGYGFATASKGVDAVGDCTDYVQGTINQKGYKSLLKELGYTV